jgi:hypothetical protein
MVAGRKTAIAILAGIIWVLPLKTVVALPFPATNGMKSPIHTEEAFFEASLSELSNPGFLGPRPISTKRIQGSMARVAGEVGSPSAAAQFAETGDDQAGKAAFSEGFGPLKAAVAGDPSTAASFSFQGRPEWLGAGRTGGKPATPVSEFDVSAILQDGFFRPKNTNSTADLAEKPLLSGVMGPELGMACSNPLTGPGPRNPATFTLVAAGFAGMAAGRFLIARF